MLNRVYCTWNGSTSGPTLWQLYYDDDDDDDDDETYRFNNFNLLVISTLNQILYHSIIFNNRPSKVQ
jgi:hypothetical protein